MLKVEVPIIVETKNIKYITYEYSNYDQYSLHYAKMMKNGWSDSGESWSVNGKIYQEYSNKL